MTTYTNEHNIPLPLQIWLATDNYEHDDDPIVISATTMLKSVRQIVLGKRYKDADRKVDFSNLVSSVMGSSIHASVEKALDRTNALQVLEKLGYTNADKIMDEMHVEVRTKKEIDDYVISGQFDMVYKGAVCDIKTSAWKYILGNGEDYRLQMSIYKWLNPEIITSNRGYIFYVFTDWTGVKAKQDSRYPQSKIAFKEYPLMDFDEIDTWIKTKLSAITACRGLADKDLPLCSDKELWREPDTYAYYSNPSNRTRATKVFDNRADAEAMVSSKGGIVQERKGKVKACKYCPYINYCNQYIDMIISGEIENE